MIDWSFILNPDTDNIEIDEPVGWSDIAFEIVRDKRFHGVSISYSLSEITLVGEGAEFLKEKYRLYGVDADVKIRIAAICDGEEQDSEVMQLDFGRYDRACGDSCSVSIGIEDIGCFTTFTNNFDKKVDMASEVAFDKVTPLEAYTGLNKRITIPPKALRYRNHADNTTATQENIADPPYFDDGTDIQSDTAILPVFQNTVESSLGTFAPSSIIDAVAHDDVLGYPPYLDFPALINTSSLLGDIRCELTEISFRFRLKGSIDVVETDKTWGLSIRVDRLPAGGDVGTPGDWVREYQSLDIAGGFHVQTGSWDEEHTIPMTIEEGDLIYLYYEFVTVDHIDDVIFRQEPESYVTMEAKSLCEETESDVFLIYEAISRVMESITNKCMTLDSDFFGRTDSEPNVYPVDGCGALECITSGLYLRNAETPNFFLSMKDLLTGLQNIHNIGFGLINDGSEVMKVEEVGYFYQDTEILDATDAAKLKMKVVPEEIPGTILGGYDKWEVENVNGLDEFNSKREFRLTVKNAKQTFDYRCKFVAGGYAIELTRLQSFAETGAADTKYDNETFIICLERSSYYYNYVYPYVDGELIVEQGGITDAANLFDADSVINFRISPERNMMRLAKLFMGVYRDHLDAGSRIELQSGDGNLLAEGWLSLDDCTPEGEVINESTPIEASIFARVEDVTPILRPESITFEYPMSLSDYKAIKANPYGYILHSCGDEEQKGHISKIVYKPNAGKASFELRNRYQ